MHAEPPGHAVDDLRAMWFWQPCVWRMILRTNDGARSHHLLILRRIERICEVHGENQIALEVIPNRRAPSVTLRVSWTAMEMRVKFRRR